MKIQHFQGNSISSQVFAKIISLNHVLNMNKLTSIILGCDVKSVGKYFLFFENPNFIRFVVVWWKNIFVSLSKLIPYRKYFHCLFCKLFLNDHSKLHIIQHLLEGKIFNHKTTAYANNNCNFMYTPHTQHPFHIIVR